MKCVVCDEEKRDSKLRGLSCSYVCLECHEKGDLTPAYERELKAEIVKLRAEVKRLQDKCLECSRLDIMKAAHRYEKRNLEERLALEHGIKND